MSLTVDTPSQTALLTTVARVKSELDISVSTHDDLLDVFVRHAGAMAEKYCRRVFFRQVYTETARAYGGPYLMTRQAPVIVLTSISSDGDVLTDVTISDAAKGVLFRENGFNWTAQRFARGGLGSGLFRSHGIPIPLTEEREYSITYTAGFIVPPQDLRSVSTVSASSADDSFNDSANGFPALLKAGDIIETSGFSNAANNGRFVVSGTPTTAKIVVDASLTTENAPADATVLVSTLPGDVERGITEIVKSLFSQRGTDSMLIEKQAGVMRLRYSENRGAGEIGLPPTAAALLRPWVRSTL